MMKMAMDRGWSILHYAAALADFGGIIDVVSRMRLEFLIGELGADVRSLNSDSATALDLAMARGEVSLLRYLLDRHERCRRRMQGRRRKRILRLRAVGDD